MTYICKTCQFVTTTKNTYNTHLISKKHKEKNPQETTPPLILDGSNNVFYECKKCNFSTFVKSAYKKHEVSKKHRENTKPPPSIEETLDTKQEIVPSQQMKELVSKLITSEFEPRVMDGNWKKRNKRFKHHLGALRMLQELSSGKVTEDDIAAYMKKHHLVDDGNDDDAEDDEDEDEDEDEAEDEDAESEEEQTENTFQHRSESPDQEKEGSETFTFYIHGPSDSVPQVRHQPYYFEFPPETPGGKLPDPPPEYKLPTFIENRRKTADSNDPEVETQQFNDIRQFIIDFLNGTQDRMGPDAERFRWQLNEITKLFIHNNMNTILNRPNLPGTI